jgi:hypothetical protein
MNNTDIYFTQNELCNTVHNEKNVWFCKFEYIFEDFATISQLDHEVIFICGNSDYSFTEKILSNKPDNIKYIFATNSTCSDNKSIFSLPIGIESPFGAKRIGHGIGFSFSQEKYSHIQRVNEQKLNIKNLIYSNFLVETNPYIRETINQKIKKSKYVTIQNKVSLENFFNEVASHEAVLCPIGNGLDTVRTYETFYCGKIPIIYGSDLIYKNIFHDMPCVYIHDIEEINDEKYIFDKIEQAKNKKDKFDKAYLKYWLQEISRKIQDLK